MSIVIGGKRIDTSKWFESFCWLDDPKAYPRITDFNVRQRWCRSIVTHTAKGITGPLRKGSKPSQRAEKLALYQTKTKRFVSWEFTIDTDGTVIWQNDPLAYYSWHATSWNPVSMGGELIQDEDGSVWEKQINVYVLVMDISTFYLGIPRQIPVVDGEVIPGVLPRADENGSLIGSDLCGIFAHHHNTEERGEGDCGVYPFRALRDAGYECFDVNKGIDLSTWKKRQMDLGMTGKSVDGLPGKETIKRLGRLWVRRPIDQELIAA